MRDEQHTGASRRGLAGQFAQKRTAPARSVKCPRPPGRRSRGQSLPGGHPCRAPRAIVSPQRAGGATHRFRSVACHSGVGSGVTYSAPGGTLPEIHVSRGRSGAENLRSSPTAPRQPPRGVRTRRRGRRHVGRRSRRRLPLPGSRCSYRVPPSDARMAHSPTLSTASGSLLSCFVRRRIAPQYGRGLGRAHKVGYVAHHRGGGRSLSGSSRSRLQRASTPTSMSSVCWYALRFRSSSLNMLGCLPADMAFHHAPRVVGGVGGARHFAGKIGQVVARTFLSLSGPYQFVDHGIN